MRNLAQHPITKDEIIETLHSSAEVALDEQIGDLRAVILTLAGMIVASTPNETIAKILEADEWQTKYHLYYK